MLQPTDIALFLISFAACVYCAVLSHRLKRLQSTKDGLGATIVAFSDSVSAMQAKTLETRSQTHELAGRLASLVNEAKLTCGRIQELTERLQEAHRDAKSRFESSAGRLNEALDRQLDEADHRMAEMKRLTDQMRVLTEGTTETIVEAIHRAAAAQGTSSVQGARRHDS